jgi:hypothetical protein
MAEHWLRLRQICLVARELKPHLEDLREVLGIEVCHVDPGVGAFGLENSLMPIGSQFLEIVAPVKEGTAGGRYLERRGGDGGYMVITQCDDHAPVRERIEKLGVRSVLDFEEGPYHGLQLHPHDTGGSFFEIDVQDDSPGPDGPWWPAGPDWQPAVRTDVVTSIAGAELQSDDPEALAERWSAIADIPIERSSAGTPEIPLENARLRFVEDRDGRGEGLGGIDVITIDRGRALAAASARGLPVDADVVTLCGTRFKLVD